MAGSLAHHHQHQWKESSFCLEPPPLFAVAGGQYGLKKLNIFQNFSDKVVPNLSVMGWNILFFNLFTKYVHQIRKRFHHHQWEQSSFCLEPPLFVVTLGQYGSEKLFTISKDENRISFYDVFKIKISFVVFVKIIWLNFWLLMSRDLMSFI